MTIRLEGLGWRVMRNLLLLFGIALILIPMYLVIANSMKTLEEAGRDFFSLPPRFYLGNYLSLLSNNNFWRYARNSTQITVFAATLVIIVVPAVSYAIARNYNKKYFKFLYFYILLGLFIPWQAIMLPVTMQLSRLNMLNPWGLILLYLAISMVRGVFLFVNYIRSIPIEIEEAARIDGCNTIQVYIKVVIHLIKPMIATLLVLDVLWFWNDFMLPLLILSRSQAFWTLPLFQYNFRTAYSFNYTMAFSAYILSMLPVIVVYFFGQKYILQGLTAGAIKG